MQNCDLCCTVPQVHHATGTVRRCDKAFSYQYFTIGRGLVLRLTAPTAKMATTQNYRKQLAPILCTTRADRAGRG